MREFYPRHRAATNPVMETVDQRRNNDPFVSVIMPVCNEADFIERTLEGVLTQDYRADLLEVLIADGMSTDATRDLIARVSRKYPSISVRVLDNPGRRAATGLNVALLAARGEVIVRVDGHTIISPDYVSQCVAALDSHEAQNVGGRMSPAGVLPFARAVALATSSRFGVGGARFHYSEREEWVDTVYMGAWPREVFHRIGLFDEEMVRNQDDEFNYRLLESGGRILLSPRIKSEYYNRTTLRSLWSQYFKYGYWKVRVMQKHPRQMRLRQFVPAALVVALLISIGAAMFSVMGKLVLIFLFGSYAILNLGATILGCMRTGDWSLLPRVPVAYAAIHFSYGLGFLIGLVGFWNRWRERLQPGSFPLESGKQL